MISDKVIDRLASLPGTASQALQAGGSIKTYVRGYVACSDT